MRSISLLPAALLCGLALTAFVLPTPQDDHEDESPLAVAMERIEHALKDLRRSVRDPEKNAASLASVLECQEASILCKKEVPAMAAAIAEDKRADFVRDYRLEMIRMERALLDLEQGILEGKDTAAVKELYNAVKATEDSGHERFTEDG